MFYQQGDPSISVKRISVTVGKRGLKFYQFFSAVFVVIRRDVRCAEVYAQHLVNSKRAHRGAYV